MPNNNSETPTTSATTTSKISALNIANVVAYLANTIITFGVGVSGRFPTNAELSAKYQTLVTPAGYAFSIWGIIFLAQLIWSIVQIALPKYRSHPLVVGVNGVGGVSYFYILVCIAQCAWTIVFSLEWIPASLVAMISILIPLVWIVQRQQQQQQLTTTRLEYWLLQFPFEIHCGWIWAASFVNFNVVLVAYDLSSLAQATLAWTSLFVLTMISLYYLFKKDQVYVIPFVVAWASYGIQAELKNPRESITNKFDDKTIQSLQMASEYLALILAAATFGILIYKKYFDNNNANGNRDGNQEPLVSNKESYGSK